jgi:hypothetical protein
MTVPDPSELRKLMVENKSRRKKVIEESIQQQDECLRLVSVLILCQLGRSVC